MQVSSVSDFEYFSQKVKEYISLRIKEIESESLDYLRAKELEVEQDIEVWLKNAHAELENEYAAQEKQANGNIAKEINKMWSEFKHKQTLLLKERLVRQLEGIFPIMAECFIVDISRKYDRGTFVIPKNYTPLINKGYFDIDISEKEEVVFKSGNLYIEYSVERIMVELEDEIFSGMYLEDGIWQR